MKRSAGAIALILAVLITGAIFVFLFTDAGLPIGVENSNSTFSGNIEYEGDSRFHSIRPRKLGDPEEFRQMLVEAISRRNGWKAILERCVRKPRGK